MLFPTFQLSGDRFPQEVGKAFALVAGGLNALKGALGEACQRLFVIDLFSAHGQNIDAITYCYKPLFCCYHLFTFPELLLSSIHQQGDTNMANRITSADREAAEQIKQKINFLKAGRRNSAVHAEIANLVAAYAALVGEVA